MRKMKTERDNKTEEKRENRYLGSITLIEYQTNKKIIKHFNEI